MTTSTTTSRNLAQSDTLTLRNVAPYALEEALRRVWESAEQCGYAITTQPTVTVTVQLEYLEGEESEANLSDMLTRLGMDSAFKHTAE